MVKANYAAWTTPQPSQTFSGQSHAERLEHLLGYAVLAPSGHNSQPWRFRLEPDALLLEADLTRTLNHSGKLAGEPMISLGSCAETLTLAGLGVGLQLGLERDGATSVRFTVKDRVEPDSQLLSAIVNRRSHRRPLDRSLKDVRLLESLADLTIGQASLRIRQDRDAIEKVAELTSEATLNLFKDQAFLDELSAWVRPNNTRRYDGMPGSTQGIPLPPSLLAKHVVKRLDTSKSQAKKDANLIRESAALGLVVREDDSAQAWFDAGRIYAHACVIAQALGVASSGVAAAALAPQTQARLLAPFGVAAGSPSALLRFGHARSELPHTPRWPVSLVTGSSPP